MQEEEVPTGFSAAGVLRPRSQISVPCPAAPVGAGSAEPQRTPSCAGHPQPRHQSPAGGSAQHSAPTGRLSFLRGTSVSVSEQSPGQRLELGFPPSAPESQLGGRCGVALPAPCWWGGEMGSSGATAPAGSSPKRRCPGLVNLHRRPHKLWQPGLSCSRVTTWNLWSPPGTCGHHPLLMAVYLNDLLAANNEFWFWSLSAGALLPSKLCLFFSDLFSSE